MKSRVFPIARKEFLHILRDWRTLLMSFGLPLVMLLLFGYAISFDIRDLRLAVLDEDETAESRKLIDDFTSSGYFLFRGRAENDGDIRGLLDSGAAQLVLSIPEGFSRSLHRNESARLGIAVDGSENNAATIAMGYAQGIISRYTLDAAVASIPNAKAGKVLSTPAVRLETRHWYNPELRSQNFIVPGLIASIMMIMTALLTSLTIVGERERGTMEQLIATPVRSYEIVLGKLVPYFLIGMLDAVMVAVAGVLIFDVPFAGSIGLFLLGTAIFAVAGLAIGLRISISAKTQVFAMQMAILTTMLPSFLLSGFMFAIKNMPGWLRTLTYLVPARYFLDILRGIFFKDQGLLLLATPMLILVGLAAFLLIVCTKTFRKKVG